MFYKYVCFNKKTKEKKNTYSPHLINVMCEHILWCIHTKPMCFHPTSLFNFNYKIISKWFCPNRLTSSPKKKIIFPTQSTFLKGRSIYENTVFNMKSFTPWSANKAGNINWRFHHMALKLDMEKGFSLSMGVSVENSLSFGLVF